MKVAETINLITTKEMKRIAFCYYPKAIIRKVTIKIIKKPWYTLFFLPIEG
jgi:hypothetical protein